MTNAELKEMVTQVEARLTEKIDAVRTEIHGVRTLLTGNGKPESGLMFRFHVIERHVKLNQRAAAAFILAVCTALGGYAVDRYTRTGEPPHDQVVTSRPAR